MKKFESKALSKAVKDAHNSSYQLKGNWTTEFPKLDYVNPSTCYTRVGLIIMDFSAEFDTRTIWEQITCPKCKGGKVEITDYCFKCLDCDFLYCEYPTKEADL